MGYNIHERYAHKAALLDEQCNCCYYCGEWLLKLPSNKVTLDHTLPKSKGGPDSFDNLVVACEHCNFTKAARTEREFTAMLDGPEPLDKDDRRAWIRYRKSLTALGLNTTYKDRRRKTKRRYREIDDE